VTAAHGPCVVDGAGARLPRGRVDDLLAKRGMAPGARLQRTRRREKHGGAVLRTRCHAYRIGSTVEIDGGIPIPSSAVPGQTLQQWYTVNAMAGAMNQTINCHPVVTVVP